MPVYKVDYLFNTSQGLAAGWSETFYLTANDAPSAMSAARDGPLRVNRLLLLDAAYEQPMIRVSDVAVLRDSLVSFANPGTFLGTYPNPNRGDASEEPWDGILIRMETGPGKRRMFTMRGIPSSVSQNTYSLAANAVWSPLFDAWVRVVKAIPLMMRQKTIVIVDGQPDTYPVIQPTAIAVSDDQRGLVITRNAGDAPQLSRGRYFQLSGVSNAWPVNKIWQVQYVTPTTIVTHGGRNLIWGEPELNRAVIQQIRYTYVGITDVTAIRGAKRNTGRPFAPLRGRRSVPGA